MTAALLAILRQLIAKYADEVLDEGFALLQRLLGGDATDEDVMEYLRRRQSGEFDA